MVRAYVLVETAAEQPSWLDEHDGSIGLGMCKGLYHSVWPNETMLHLDCADVDSLSEAVVQRVPQLKGVTRVITCAVLEV